MCYISGFYDMSRLFDAELRNLVIFVLLEHSRESRFPFFIQVNFKSVHLKDYQKHSKLLTVVLKTHVTTEYNLALLVLNFL